MQFCRSEGFPNTGYLLPARGTLGVSPDGESSWDAVAAAAAVSRLEIQVDILAGELYLEFVPMESALVEVLDALRPGLCTEFRYLSDGQNGLAWGAIFEKMPKY